MARSPVRNQPSAEHRRACPRARRCSRPSPRALDPELAGSLAPHPTVVVDDANLDAGHRPADRVRRLGRARPPDRRSAERARSSRSRVRFARRSARATRSARSQGQGAAPETASEQARESAAASSGRLEESAKHRGDPGKHGHPMAARSPRARPRARSARQHDGGAGQQRGEQRAVETERVRERQRGQHARPAASAITGPAHDSLASCERAVGEHRALGPPGAARRIEDQRRARTRPRGRRPGGPTRPATGRPPRRRSGLERDRQGSPRAPSAFRSLSSGATVAPSFQPADERDGEGPVICRSKARCCRRPSRRRRRGSRRMRLARRSSSPNVSAPSSQTSAGCSGVPARGGLEQRRAKFSLTDAVQAEDSP